MSSYITKIGPMDGNLWEEICQLVFKKLYRQFGYQEMPASPAIMVLRVLLKTMV